MPILSEKITLLFQSVSPYIRVTILILLIFLYFLPGIVASSRRTRNRVQVWIINIFLGLSFIGWVVALAMAFSPNVEVDETPGIDGQI